MSTCFYYVLSLMLPCMHAYAMENNTVQITIKTLTEQYTLPVVPTTTILEIKTMLEDREGIPVAQQGMCAVVSAPYTFGWYKTFSDNLLPEVTVQEIKNNYRTSLFKLYLISRIKKQ